jgi:hypothetical protein
LTSKFEGKPKLDVCASYRKLGERTRRVFKDQFSPMPARR